MPKIDVHKTAALTGHRDCVYTVEKSGEERVFFSAGGDGFIARWELPDIHNAEKIDSQSIVGKVIARIPASVYALCYLPDTDQLIAGHNQEGIHLIDLRQNKEVGSAKITESAVFDIRHHDNRIFVACGDGSIIILDRATLTPQKYLKFSEASARSLAINPVSGELAAGYSDAHIRVFDLHNYDLKYNIAAHQNSVFCVRYSPDYKFLLSGSRDAHLKIWTVENSYRLHESIVAHLYTINHIEYSSDGSHFATCSKDKSVKVWNAKSFKLLKVIDKARYAGHGTSVNKLLWATCHGQLIACSDDRSISVWDVKFN